MSSRSFPVHGAGLGLRRSMLSSLADQATQSVVDFWEVAPENWIGVGGRYGHKFRELTEQFPFICHGLSLSIGGPSPLDEAFLHRLKRFLKDHHIRIYSEHLSYCSDDGHLYDLLPIPFTAEAIYYVANRIRQVQEILEQRIAIENVSYYAAPGKQLEEIDFINAVLQEADCDLLLDVNNIYVNSVNHGYDAEAFLQRLPVERIRYIHVAGHFKEAEDLIVDTHGADVIDPVWQLLDKTYQRLGVIPTLLERDFNIPPIADLLREVATIHSLQTKWRNETGGYLQHA
ncbi:HvfB family MNIO-type RiPP peptide maturase [Nitrosomonas sp. wSCUT-2]